MASRMNSTNKGLPGFINFARFAVWILLRIAPRLRATFRVSAYSMPVSQFTRPSVEYFHRRWFTKPKFYVPIGAAFVFLIGFGIYFWSVASSLSEEAKTFDLTKLEQMDSA